MQMYTLRAECAADYPGTLRDVARIGYRAVQVSGLHQCTAREIRKAMDDLGLGSAGTHVSLDLLEKQFEAAVEMTKDLGTEWAIVPYLPEDRRRTADDWRRFAATMNDLGLRLREVDLRLAYHNPAFEFQKFAGRSGYDIFFEAADSGLVHPEIDTYWVQHGGEKPAEYNRRYGNRCPLVHLKDMLADEQKTFAEVGSGILDWPAIFKASEAADAKWYIVEQDRCQRPPLESAKISFANLKKMKVV